ncbi:hypothetical protein CSAL01_13268 [Colletotrichum salicis]|uniref:Uncharacterized protein n=1 Tax=Colletotrichum salicis TaxID=1209931 RepID=A0A135V717_9PEZI|nr:hypothetical protein CSAL01_13268 [Colletotrichum salicis]
MYMTETYRYSPFLVTALYVAASKGFFEIVSFLLDHGADIDGVPDCRLRTPAFLSLLSGDAKTSMILLRRGARLESPEFGINALHQAAAAGLVDVITYLVNEKRMRVNEGDNNGDTPLIHSLLSPSPETVIGHLAQFDGDVNQPTTIDTWRMTALSMACEDGMFSAALALLKAGADATGELDGLIEGADPALQTGGRTGVAKQRLVDLLLKSGADPNATVCISARCNWTGPLLLKLVRARRRWEAEMLLSSGLVEIDKRDSHGATSLDWTLSISRGNPLMASILLRRGAKMDDAVLRDIIGVAEDNYGPGHGNAEERAKPDPDTNGNTSEDDCTAPNTPDLYKAFSELGKKAEDEYSATMSITAVAALMQEIANNKWPVVIFVEFDGSEKAMLKARVPSQDEHIRKGMIELLKTSWQGGERQ